MYGDWRNEVPAEPASELKLLGMGAYFSFLMVCLVTFLVGFMVSSPLLAWSIIASFALLVAAIQLRCWWRHFMVVKPARARAAAAYARADEARARHEKLVAENKERTERTAAALASYQEASAAGRAALEALGSRASTPADRKRVLIAWQDYRAAQSKFDSEPDLAARFHAMAEAIRSETSRIEAIRFRF